MQESCIENSLSGAVCSMWIFSVGLDNVVTICNKMQVVYKEMTCDGAKSCLAKWNLIGGVQFKHMKHCLMFM